MTHFISRAQKLILVFILIQLFLIKGFTQYKEFKLTDKGDTINAIDNKNLKQGKWIIRVEELRGEPGYEEEGVFIDGKKDGLWRRYTFKSDLIAIENYLYGGKDGVQQYFNQFGDLIREESWRGYNPDAPYDTIPVYGTGSNEILSYKIVKAEQYSIKHGEWKFYDPATGRIIKSEMYEHGALQKPPEETAVADEKPKKIEKPKEVLEFEKKNSGRKKVKLREGQTGY